MKKYSICFCRLHASHGDLLKPNSWRSYDKEVQLLSRRRGEEDEEKEEKVACYGIISHPTHCQHLRQLVWILKPLPSLCRMSRCWICGSRLSSACSRLTCQFSLESLIESVKTKENHLKLFHLPLKLSAWQLNSFVTREDVILQFV